MGSTIDSFTFVRSGRMEFFCPLCHNHQVTSISSKLNWREHARIMALTLALTFVLWEILAGATLLAYMVIWAVYEFVHRTRKRTALVCRTCGFDPFLYKQDVQKARVAVRQFWEDRIEKEGLYRGIKLKNYRTAPPPAPPVESSPEVGTS